VTTCQTSVGNYPLTPMRTKRATKKTEAHRVKRKRLAQARRQVKSGLRASARNLVCTDCGEDVSCLTCGIYAEYADYSVAERMEAVLSCRECGEETVACRSCMESILGPDEVAELSSAAQASVVENEEVRTA